MPRCIVPEMLRWGQSSCLLAQGQIWWQPPAPALGLLVALQEQSPGVELEVDGAWITQSVLKKTINDERRWLSTTWIFQVKPGYREGISQIPFKVGQGSCV